MLTGVVPVPVAGAGSAGAGGTAYDRSAQRGEQDQLSVQRPVRARSDDQRQVTAGEPVPGQPRVLGERDGTPRRRARRRGGRGLIYRRRAPSHGDGHGEAGVGHLDGDRLCRRGRRQQRRGRGRAAGQQRGRGEHVARGHRLMRRAGARGERLRAGRRVRDILEVRITGQQPQVQRPVGRLQDQELLRGQDHDAALHGEHLALMRGLAELAGLGELGELRIGTLLGPAPGVHGRADFGSLITEMRRVSGRRGRGGGPVAGNNRCRGHCATNQDCGRDADPGLHGAFPVTPIAGHHRCLLVP